MPLIEIHRTPSQRELRWFGLILAAGLAVLGIISFRWLASATYVLWAVAILLLLIYYRFPSARRPVFLAWIYAAYPIGWVVSHLVMMAVYYGCVTPIGLVLRLVGYDPLQLRRPQRTSHWHQRPAPPPVPRYFRQF